MFFFFQKQEICRDQRRTSNELSCIRMARVVDYSDNTCIVCNRKNVFPLTTMRLTGVGKRSSIHGRQVSDMRAAGPGRFNLLLTQRKKLKKKNCKIIVKSFASRSVQH